LLNLTTITGLVLAAIFSQTTGLAGLVFISMVLQAASVLDIKSSAITVTQVAAYGVTPFHAMALVVGIVWLTNLIRQRAIKGFAKIKTPLTLLFLYGFVAVLGAFILPEIFKNTPVHLLLEIYGADLPPQPLRPTISNAVQAINLIVLIFVLLYFIQEANSGNKSKHIISGLAGGCVLVLFVGFFEQISNLKGWPSLTAFWANNPGYSQAPSVPMNIMLKRVGLPFSEPSYASVYLAAMTLGFWAVTFLGRNWRWTLFAALLTTLGLINTFGSTGWVAAGLAFMVLMVISLSGVISRVTNSNRRFRIVFLSMILVFGLAGAFLAIQGTELQPKVETTLKTLVFDKAKETNGLRERTNRRAMEIVKETYGFGVGLGSNRASSYFASLLSNTGVLGFALFVSMLASLLWRYWRASTLSDMQIFVAAALPTATLAMGLGIPDLNMPMYWGFIFLGFVFCPGSEVLEDVRA